MSFLNQIFEEGFKNLDHGRFPLSLGVEVTNHCNLKCPMCPREIAERGYGRMSWDLWQKISDESAQHAYRIVMPQGFGESFLHPRFREMLAYLGEKNVHPVMVITNATLLSEKNIDALIDANIDFVNISLDGTVKEIYEGIRVNARYEQVVENVQRFFERRKARGAELPRVILRMIKMKETEPDVERFKELWEPWIEPGDEIAFSSYQTWNGSVDDKRTDKPEGVKALEKGHKGPCRMVYKTGQVYYDGRMTPCCYDYDCEMDIGNVNDQSIEDIWTGERAQHFRRLHEEGRIDEIPICRGCQEYIP